MAVGADSLAVGAEAFTEAAGAPVEAASAAAGLAMEAEDIEAALMGARVPTVAEALTEAEVLVAARPREASERTGDRTVAHVR